MWSCFVSCRAEVLCYQIVQSHVVFSYIQYVISQSDVEHDYLAVLLK